MKTSLKNQTLNFHLTKACNYRCKFCFVNFKELKEIGRFYMDFDGKHTYSDSVLEIGLVNALSEILKNHEI